MKMRCWEDQFRLAEAVLILFSDAYREECSAGSILMKEAAQILLRLELDSRFQVLVLDPSVPSQDTQALRSHLSTGWHLQVGLDIWREFLVKVQTYESKPVVLWHTGGLTKVDIRKRPRGAVIQSFPNGQQCIVFHKLGDQLQILETTSGITGWVNSRDTRPDLSISSQACECEDSDETFSL